MSKCRRVEGILYEKCSTDPNPLHCTSTRYVHYTELQFLTPSTELHITTIQLPTLPFDTIHSIELHIKTLSALLHFETIYFTSTPLSQSFPPHYTLLYEKRLYLHNPSLNNIVGLQPPTILNHWPPLLHKCCASSYHRTSPRCAMQVTALHCNYWALITALRRCCIIIMPLQSAQISACGALVRPFTLPSGNQLKLLFLCPCLLMT